VKDINFISANKYDKGIAASIAGCVLMCTTLLLLLPAAVQADDLFDAQMQLARKGDAEAQFKVGEMYETGVGVASNKREAIYWTTRAANQKHETAGFKLLYWDIEKKGLNDTNKARLEQLNNKAKQGNPQAQYYLGTMYAHGIGIHKNTDVAIEWLSKAASVGVLEAELELASLTGEQKRKAHKERRFESDPCSGKAARYLSTCK
jgi:TPR repeat protein